MRESVCLQMHVDSGYFKILLFPYFQSKQRFEFWFCQRQVAFQTAN